MTTIYNYHPSTGEYLSESQASLDPLEGKPLVPAFATVKKPPSIKSNQCAVFSNGDWVLESDFRGTDYWLADGTNNTIQDLGETLPEKALTEAPAPTLEKLKEDALSAVKTFATETRAKLTGYADQYQLAGWVGKSEIAKRVIAGTATDQEVASIQAEVDKRGQGETVEGLATKQLEKSTKLTIASAIIDGLESSAVTAIKSKQKESTLAALMETLLVDAEAELQALLEANQ
jgi:hypothetical protein